MNILQLVLRRPLTIIVLVIAVILGGALALKRMSRDIFPPLGIPTIYVAQPYGGMDPAQMEGYLTYYYEYHFLYITGIEHVESKSIQGASVMKLQFHPGTDMSAAMSEVVAYVNRARAFMPAGTPGPFMMRFDAGSVAVGYLVFSTDNPAITLGQMQDAALNRVRPLFATLPGVSAPPPFGGSARSIVVNVNPERMRAYGLSPDEIVQAMSQGNLISPSGNMILGDKYPIVPINSVVKNVKDLEAVPLRTVDGRAVFVRDVARVEDGSDITTSYALANGLRTVYIPVTKRADASTLEVVRLVKENIGRFQSVLPEGVKVAFEFDQSPAVVRAINDVTNEGVIGAALTGLMVLLFLRDWRSALIVVINIPLSLLFAVTALWVMGYTINLMTLGGLALAVGILVDMSTVAIENIHTHLASGKGVARSVLDSTREVMLPLLIAMLCVLAVFIPALFMTGAARALFMPMALAVGFSMIAAFAFSASLVPVLSIWMVRGHRKQELATAARTHTTFARFQSAYARLLRGVVAARWLVVVIYIVASVGVVWFVGRQLGLEIFPKVDTGQMAIRFRAPTGTRLDLTEVIGKKVLDLVAQEAGRDKIAVTIGLVGVHASNYPVNLIHQWNGGPEEGWLAIQLKSHSEVDTDDLAERLRTVFARELPDVRFSFEPADIINRVMSFGSFTPIEVAVSGPSLAASKAHADKLYEKLKTLPTLRDVQIAQALDFPTVDVNVDRERAGLLGVRVSDVARSLVAATTSSRFTVANFWSDPNSGVSYNLQVQIPQRESSIEDLQNVPVSSRGSPVLLRNVASVMPGTAVGTYERYNMARVVSITANIRGADLGTVSRQISTAIGEVGPAADGRTAVAQRGQIVPLQELLNGFQAGLIVVIVVIFLLLAANFQSVQLAIVVVSTLPAVLAGVVLALWLTGTTLNIQSAMGAIMTIGVAVANAILLVTFAERSRIQSGDALAAAVDGAQSRLRPILMTSMAMIAGMMPMSLAIHAEGGGGQAAPLGRAVVGGLAVATIATLFVLPAFFALIRKRSSTRSRSLDPDDPLSGHFVSPAGHD
ncbi:MAG: efflux RND transporter permease subunit [Opitutus sp.]